MSTNRYYRERVQQLPAGSEEIRACTHGVLWRLPTGNIVLVAVSHTEDPRAKANFAALIRRGMRADYASSSGR